MAQRLAKLKDRLKNVDYWILIPYFILCIIGIIAVFSASSNIGLQNGGNATSYLVKQTGFVIVGAAIIYVMFRLNIPGLQSKRFLNITGILFILIFMGLKLFGRTVNGSAGWIPIGGINIQPAEIAKAYLIMLIASMVQRNEQDPSVFDSWKRFFSENFWPIGIALVISIAIFLLPDLGGALIGAAIVVIMILAAGFSYKRSIGILIGLLGIAFGFLMLLAGPLQNLSILKHNYMMQRIIAFSNPFKYADGVGQQLVNSYYAISNGGLFGTGIGNSIQKTGYLPEPNTDFIMAIVAEESGVIMVIIIMALLFLIIGRIIYIGNRSRDTYGTMFCYGTATYLVVETYFNIGGVTGLLPITGVTFPFISYGGSSMITICFCLGVILRIDDKQVRLRNQRKKG